MATGAVVETVAETVADELELASVAARRIDAKAISSVSIGVGIGVVVGFYIGYRYNKKKLRAEIYAEAEKDIEAIREHYQQKIIAAEHNDRPSVEALVKEKGYVTDAEAGIRSLSPPVPLTSPSPVVSTRRDKTETTNVFRSSETEKDKNENWDFEQELADRDKEIYIIHQDEYLLNESGYAQVSYIYYAKDDTLVDEADPQNVLSNREDLIGTESLKLFGHGADDYNLVHVRNDELELEIVINNVAKSWEVEVLGLDPDESG